MTTSAAPSGRLMLIQGLFRMSCAPQLALFLGLTLAFYIPPLEASRLKDCGNFGCYEEPTPDAARWGFSDILESADKLLFLDKDFDNRTTEELKSSMTFYLYTSSDQSESAMIGDEQLFSSFGKDKKTKIIIHGWHNDYQSEIGQGIKDAYIQSGISANIIVVDWAEGSSRLYNRAKACVPLVANIVAKFIDRLVDEKGMSLDNLHIIGHSLGGHVSGLAGVRITKGKPARVTGLDPARPTFDNEKTERISKLSAKYVDIIHSSGNLLGLMEPLGHVDYYPNRGDAIQRGCENDWDASCSHSRSHQFYAESITNPKGFEATLCSNWLTFRIGLCKNNPTLFIGEEIPTQFTEGSYFLKTGSAKPYAAGAQSRTMTEKEIEEDDEDKKHAEGLFVNIV